jgi:hypothetical protein
MEDIMRSCERHATADTETECPLCLQATPSLTQLRRHLGKHHEELSLFALPPSLKGREDETDNDHSDQESRALSAGDYDDEPSPQTPRKLSADLHIGPLTHTDEPCTTEETNTSSEGRYFPETNYFAPPPNQPAQPQYPQHDQYNSDPADYPSHDNFQPGYPPPPIGETNAPPEGKYFPKTIQVPSSPTPTIDPLYMQYNLADYPPPTQSVQSRYSLYGQYKPADYPPPLTEYQPTGWRYPQTRYSAPAEQVHVPPSTADTRSGDHWPNNSSNELSSQQQAVPDNRVMHTFTWGQGAAEVFVTGDFDEWRKTVKLEKQDDVFAANVAVARCKQRYKFVVDDRWMTDDSQPRDTNGIYANNVLHPEHIRVLPKVPTFEGHRRLEPDSSNFPTAFTVSSYATCQANMKVAFVHWQLESAFQALLRFSADRIELYPQHGRFPFGRHIESYYTNMSQVRVENNSKGSSSLVINGVSGQCVLQLYSQADTKWVFGYLQGMLKKYNPGATCIQEVEESDILDDEVETEHFGLLPSDQQQNLMDEEHASEKLQPSHVASTQVRASDDEVESSADGKLYCICRKPRNNERMIVCQGGCNDLFHSSCMGIQQADKFLVDNFICLSCEGINKRRITRCKHSFKMIKSDTNLILWNCDQCHSGPHWYIYECSNCTIKTCRPCTAKV